MSKYTEKFIIKKLQYENQIAIRFQSSGFDAGEDMRVIQDIKDLERLLESLKQKGVVKYECIDNPVMAYTDTTHNKQPQNLRFPVSADFIITKASN